MFKKLKIHKNFVYFSSFDDMNKMNENEFILTSKNHPCYGCPNRQFNKMNHFVHFVQLDSGRVIVSSYLKIVQQTSDQFFNLKFL